MGILFEVLGGAVSILQAYTGSAAAAKASGYIQDAVGVIGALTPLVQSFGKGEEVTDEDVRNALAKAKVDLKAFDDAIAAKGG